MLGFEPLCSSPLASALDEPEAGEVLARPGAFVLTGKGVTLRAARILSVGAGSYVLTGGAVVFVLSAAPEALIRVPLSGTTSVQKFGYAMIQNFNMRAGDDKTLIVTVRNAVGTAINLTGASIKWRCARSYGKAATIAKATSGSGISITDAVNGIFAVTLDSADTEDLQGIFLHEAEVTASDGTISTVLSGTMKVHRQLIAT